ncbi:MAG: gluconate 2-dehydrogenase subunit 3 family protein [Gemmatimonadota bacterium]
MTFSPLERRQFIALLAGGVGAVWLGAAPRDLSAAAAKAAAARDDDPWRVLSATEAQVLEAIAEQIIPSDDTPGAREARVVRFMDNALATFAAAELPAWRTGFGEVQAIVQHRRPGLASFAQMEKTEQADLLRALEHARSGFFQLVIIATLQGMFSNPEYGGNHDKIGWQLLGFQDRFVWSAPFGDYDRE